MKWGNSLRVSNKVETTPAKERQNPTGLKFPRKKFQILIQIQFKFFMGEDTLEATRSWLASQTTSYNKKTCPSKFFSCRDAQTLHN